MIVIEVGCSEVLGRWQGGRGVLAGRARRMPRQAAAATAQVALSLLHPPQPIPQGCSSLLMLCFQVLLLLP